MKRIYKIADLVVEMDSFGKTERQAEKFLLNETCLNADIVIRPERERIQERFPSLSWEDVEYMATGSSFHRQILQFNGLMLHSSAVVMDGKAYMFSAPCGTGKSTHTQLWIEAFGKDKAKILNDDKPILRCIDNQWYAYGTPWSGKTDKNMNLRVPVAGICFISRGEQNRIRRFDDRESIQPLLTQMPKPRDFESRIKILELLDGLIGSIPIWGLECNMSTEAAFVSYEAMRNGK